MKRILIPVLLLAAALPLAAQLPTPGAEGVTAGHHIFRTKDVEAANKFWMTLGGEPAALANIKLMKFPGVLLFISAPRGGANPPPSIEGMRGTIAGPEGVQVRITEDKKLTVPIASDGLVMNVANAGEVSAWYAKWFGAKISKSGADTIGEIPGARIVFRTTKDPIAPTKGHSLNLLGFEVNDIQDFVKRYQEAGGKLDGQIATAQAAKLSVVQLTDPWGTSIEVSQGLNAVK